MSATRGQLEKAGVARRLEANRQQLPAISQQLPATFQFDQQANCEYPYRSVSDCVKFSYR